MLFRANPAQLYWSIFYTIFQTSSFHHLVSLCLWSYRRHRWAEHAATLRSFSLVRFLWLGWRFRSSVHVFLVGVVLLVRPSSHIYPDGCCLFPRWCQLPSAFDPHLSTAATQLCTMSRHGWPTFEVFEAFFFLHINGAAAFLGHLLVCSIIEIHPQ